MSRWGRSGPLKKRVKEPVPATQKNRPARRKDIVLSVLPDGVKIYSVFIHFVEPSFSGSEGVYSFSSAFLFSIPPPALGSAEIPNSFCCRNPARSICYFLL